LVNFNLVLERERFIWYIIEYLLYGVFGMTEKNRGKKKLRKPMNISCGPSSFISFRNFLLSLSFHHTNHTLEFLEKQPVRLDISLWGTTMLLVKMEDGSMRLRKIFLFFLNEKEEEKIGSKEDVILKF
jgi:hypothetical protein